MPCWAGCRGSTIWTRPRPWRWPAPSWTCGSPRWRTSPGACTPSCRTVLSGRIDSAEAGSSAMITCGRSAMARAFADTLPLPAGELLRTPSAHSRQPEEDDLLPRSVRRPLTRPRREAISTRLCVMPGTRSHVPYAGLPGMEGLEPTTLPIACTRMAEYAVSLSAFVLASSYPATNSRRTVRTGVSVCQVSLPVGSLDPDIKLSVLSGDLISGRPQLADRDRRQVPQLGAHLADTGPGTARCRVCHGRAQRMAQT